MVMVMVQGQVMFPSEGCRRQAVSRAHNLIIECYTASGTGGSRQHKKVRVIRLPISESTPDLKPLKFQRCHSKIRQQRQQHFSFEWQNNS